MSVKTVGEATPLWLDIKIEYIDENLENVIRYLYDGVADNSKSKDSFYAVTLNLLDRRIKALLDARLGERLSCDERSKDEIFMELRLLGTWLLLHDEEGMDKTKVYVAFLSSLQVLEPDSSLRLTELALDAAVGKTNLSKDKLPFGWSDMISLDLETGLKVLSCKILDGQRMRPKGAEEWWLEQKGALHLSQTRFEAANMGKDVLRLKLLGKEISESLKVFDRMSFLTLKADRLKESDKHELDMIRNFADDFISNLKTTAVDLSTLKNYEIGDQLKVKAVIDDDGEVHLESIDPEYAKIKGSIAPFVQWSAYDRKSFTEHLREGDVFPIYLKSEKSFDVERLFRNHIKSTYSQRGDERVGIITNVISQTTHYRKLRIWTEDGYDVVAKVTSEDYDIDDYVVVLVKNTHVEDWSADIEAQILSLADGLDSTEYEQRDICIESFVEGFEPENIIPEVLVKELVRMMFVAQRSLTTISERCQVLAAIRILCAMMLWKEDQEYVSFLTQYLENLSNFAQGNYEKMKGIVPIEGLEDHPAIGKRVNIVKILEAFGKSDTDEMLDGFVDNGDDELEKLALLVKANNSLSAYIEPKMMNTIRHEVIKELAIHEGEFNLEEEGGVCLGEESGRLEFKTSFFFAPKGAEMEQKMTILKEICAFLNSREGGVLYIGVNDSGKISGLDMELKELAKIRTGNYSGIDGYMRYITDQVKAYLGVGVATNVTILPKYDNQVVSIQVDPYEYGIVELRGTAYVRLNSESVVMNEDARRKILADRQGRNKAKYQCRTALDEAIANHRCVVLKGYSSSHGGDVRDREVEPYAFCSDGELVSCFDLGDNKCKVFKLERISGVQLTKNPWRNQVLHVEMKTDLFRMTGSKSYHIKLQLEMAAKNILLEEYKEARNMVQQTASPNLWLLETDVYSLAGVGRFYIGLANYIRIIDSPDLVKYVKDYKEKYL